MQKAVSPSHEDYVGKCEQPFPSTLDFVGPFAVMGADSLEAIDTGDTADLVCLEWLGRRNSPSGRRGVPRVGAACRMVRVACGMYSVQRKVRRRLLAVVGDSRLLREGALISPLSIFRRSFSEGLISRGQ